MNEGEAIGIFVSAVHCDRNGVISWFGRRGDGVGGSGDGGGGGRGSNQNCMASKLLTYCVSCYWWQKCRLFSQGVLIFYSYIYLFCVDRPLYHNNDIRIPWGRCTG